MRKRVFIVLMLAQSLLCRAQADPDFGSLVPMWPNSSTNNIHIIGYVPKFLKLTLDFSPDEKARLVGFYQVHPPEKEDTKHPGLEFTIRADKAIELGTAILVSNIEGPYTIFAFSSNAGRLRTLSGSSEASLGYSLLLGGQIAKAEKGVFRFSESGKSRKGGNRLEVGIVMDEIDPLLPRAVYADELSFSVAAN